MKTEKIFFWGIGILIIVAVGLGIWRGWDRSSSPAQSLIEIGENEWIRGNRTASTTLIEYSDFQCPACGAYYPILKQLHQEFGNELRFVYRHFPLRQIHFNAELAARAAEAAGKQRKFWEMHDMIFENQKEWSERGSARNSFIQYAQSLGLDVERFKNDMDAKETKQKVSANYNGGVGFGVNSTPTFFFNGEKLRNPGSYEEFKAVIQAGLAR